MFRIFLTRVLAAAKNAIIGYNGHLLCENGDFLMTEDDNNLDAEGGDN